MNKPAPQTTTKAKREATVAAPGATHGQVPAPDRAQAQPQQHEATVDAPATAKPSSQTSPRRLRRWLLAAAGLVGLAAAGYFLVPWFTTMLNTVSTDDAYVNGHVTFVAPRVAGQVARVLVDDNMRVAKGTRLVELDKEPYQVQVEIKRAAVASAQADLAAAQADVRAAVAQARARRFKLEHAIEDVHTQVANLRADVATLASRRADLALAQANLKRGEELVVGGGISKEALDERRKAVQVAAAMADQALQTVYATRVSLGLAKVPDDPEDLADVPGDLAQNFSAVRQALGELLESAAAFGYAPATWDATPKQAIEQFYQQDPEGNLDRILARVVAHAPAIEQAESRLEQARRDLDQAELNLSYCDVVSEIDGVVTRRNVNPGNNVQAGQSLMAVRSLSEIWIDANFKETQLARLRIGQRVRCAVDMYGRRREFDGRITGFTMGTGQTLSLLPPQNATGNFVKIVQRLPVRIELTDYDPDQEPLFVGLSVVPYVYYKEPPSGPHAGAVLQPFGQVARQGGESAR